MQTETIYDKACELAVCRQNWNNGEQVELWRGDVRGQTTRLFLQRDGGFVGVKLSFAGSTFIEQYSVAMLTPNGWQLMAWASRKGYDAWVNRAKQFIKTESRRRRNTTPALWVTEAA